MYQNKFRLKRSNKKRDIYVRQALKQISKERFREKKDILRCRLKSIYKDLVFNFNLLLIFVSVTLLFLKKDINKKKLILGKNDLKKNLCNIYKMEDIQLFRVPIYKMKVEGIIKTIYPQWYLKRKLTHQTLFCKVLDNLKKQ